MFCIKKAHSKSLQRFGPNFWDPVMFIVQDHVPFKWLRLKTYFRMNYSSAKKCVSRPKTVSLPLDCRFYNFFSFSSFFFSSHLSADGRVQLLLSFRRSVGKNERKERNRNGQNRFTARYEIFALPFGKNSIFKPIFYFKEEALIASLFVMAFVKVAMS